MVTLLCNFLRCLIISRKYIFFQLLLPLITILNMHEWWGNISNLFNSKQRSIVRLVMLVFLLTLKINQV